MDIADIADDVVQQNIDSARALAAKFKPRTPTGFCMNCDEQVDHGGLFCDASCRDEEQRREAARLRAGAH